jgi:hypothetical protein
MAEASPIQIDIKKYELPEESGQTRITLGEIETSHEWINQTVHDYLPQGKKSFAVPGGDVKMLM